MSSIGAGVVFAAGLSTRMGRSKAMLEWCGRPLVVYQVQQLQRAGLRDVVVVTGHESIAVEQAVSTTSARCVHNPAYAEGRATSVRTAAEALAGSSGAVVLLNVDQPRHAGTIRELLAAHADLGGLITVPTFSGRRGHPIVLSSSLLPELLTVTEEEQGLLAVSRRHHAARIEVPLGRDEVLFDLNDSAAYKQLREQWRDCTEHNAM